MWGKYWRRVRTKAWGDTLHALSLDSPARVTARILIAAIAVALIGYFFGAQDFQAKLQFGLLSAGAVGIAFALFFLINVLFLVPAKLDAEANEKIRTLETELEQNIKDKSTREERQAVIDELAEEIDWATQNLLNPKPHPLKEAEPQAATKKWSVQCNTWFEKVSAKLANRKYFTRAQQLHFDTLGNVEQFMTQGPSRFVKTYDIVSTKIKRLRDLIEQLSRV